MLIVSNHLFSKSNIKFPEDVIARINIAWIKDLDELKKLLSETKHDVYLDYPQGRTKPPKPTISLVQSLALVHQYKNIKYFAVSNVEEPESMEAIKMLLPRTVKLIPKIETKKGVHNLEAILTRIKAKYIMLDKEDLYLDADRDNLMFEQLVDEARQKCLSLGVAVLELHGVVFIDLKQ